MDSLLAEALPHYSRATLKKAIMDGYCLLDGLPLTRPDAKARSGQCLELVMPVQGNALVPEDGDLEIIWQDDYLVLCNKPPDLTVHPCPSCPERTLVQRLLKRFPQLATLEGQRPGIVHRLDKDTSGLLLVALTESARLRLSDAFAQREIHKEYLALVSGLPPETGQCTESIGRHPAVKVKMAVLESSHGGKEAHTEWRRLWHSPNRDVSLLAIRIYTGRTHQIRVHMAHLGYPLLGDKLYAPSSVRDMASRQMLHAWRLAFAHPVNGEKLQFSCPPPKDLLTAALSTCRKMQRIVLTGNPACGKSSLAAVLRGLGIPVISADDVVHGLYAPEGEVSLWIRRHWGEELLTPEGSVDRHILMDVMQESPILRRELEDLVHMLVHTAVLQFWQSQEKSGATMAVAEIPLFFECGWQTSFMPQPLVVGVHCPQSLRHERSMRNRGWSAEKIATIEAWQWSEARKEAACDLLFDNSGPREGLEAAARRLLGDLAVLAGQEEEQQILALRSCWSEDGTLMPEG